MAGALIGGGFFILASLGSQSGFVETVPGEDSFIFVLHGLSSGLGRSGIATGRRAGEFGVFWVVCLRTKVLISNFVGLGCDSLVETPRKQMYVNPLNP